MEELAQLQLELARVQQQETTLKLSDHNVIDLLAKLQQVGKLEMIPTLSGKEIVTPLQVDRELVDVIALHNGRTSVTELQHAIGIDRVYIEQRLGLMSRSSRLRNQDATMQHFVINSGEEVVTSSYLDAIMEDTNVLLQDSGTMTMGALAQQYGVAVDYMKEVVMSRLGSILQAHERDNVLYTTSFVETQKAQIRGVFTALTRPALVPELVHLYGFDPKVTDEYLAELIHHHVVVGMLHGREFVPLVFATAQRKNMYSFFQQNGFLDHARANDLQVARPYEFLKKRFPDAIPLKNCVVSHALLVQMESAIEVAIQDKTYVDVQHIMPSAISSIDLAMLISKSSYIASSTAQAVQLCDVYVVSNGMIERCMEACKADASSKATKAATRHHASGIAFDEPPSNFGDKCGDVSMSKRGKRVMNEKSKSKRGKKTGTVRGSHRDSSMTITPSHEGIVELIIQACPHTQDDEELLDSIVDCVETDVEAIYSSALTAAMSTILSGAAVSHRDLRKNFEDKFEELFQLLSCYNKGFRKLELRVDSTDEAAAAELKNIESHMLDTLAIELATLVTSYTVETNNLELENVPPIDALLTKSSSQQQTSLLMESLSEDNENTLQENLAPATASAIVTLWTLSIAGQRSVEDLLLHIPIVANALGLPIRKIDRKRERAIILGCRRLTMAALNTVARDAHSRAAALVAQLVFQQRTNLPIVVPPRVSTATLIVQVFEKDLDESLVTTLHGFFPLAEHCVAGESWNQTLDHVRSLVAAKDAK